MEIIGDPVAPSELIIPVASVVEGEQPAKTGALFMSGAKLYIYTGSASELINSS